MQSNIELIQLRSISMRSIEDKQRHLADIILHQ